MSMIRSKRVEVSPITIALLASSELSVSRQGYCTGSRDAIVQLTPAALTGNPPTARSDGSRITGGLASWQKRRALEMLEANLENKQSLRSVAGACRLSDSHFSRSFRASIGMSFHRWLVRCRVERAKTLLVTTELSLAEIALCCGFSDQSHFCHTFKKAVSTTPSRWRAERRSMDPGREERRPQPPSISAITPTPEFGLM